MDSSQRWMSGQEALRSSPRLKLVAVVSAALFGAGSIALELANIWPAYPASGLSVSDCNQNRYSDPDWIADCSSAVMVTDSSPVSDSTATESAATHTDKALPTRHANIRRARDDRQSILRTLRPGYTMAEICAAKANKNGLSCQTGSYDGKFNAFESGAASANTSGYAISGRVITAEGEGLNGVRIVGSPERLKGQKNLPYSGKLRFWTITDSLGAYSLDGLPDGEYMVRSSTHGDYQSARISVRAGVDYADLVVARNTRTVVDGQVLSDTGEPLEGVTVLPHLLGQPSVLTGDDGRFSLQVALKPTVRSFSLRFQRPGYAEETGEISFVHAEAVTDTTVNIVMSPVEAWTVLTGTVSSETGDTLVGRTVELRPKSAHRAYSVTTDTSGRYSFPMVEAPADYHLIVYGGANHKDYQQLVVVTPDMGELDLVIEAYQFGELSGRLVNLNGEPVPDFDLVLRNTDSRKANTVVSTDKSGNFKIPAVPAGELIIASQSTPSILVQGIYLNPGDKLHLPIVLDWGEHELHGMVVDAYNNPVPASRIVLQWSHESDGVTTKATRRTAADSQGHFAFSKLGPGPHSLQINAPGFPPVDIEHDLSRQGYELTVRLN